MRRRVRAAVLTSVLACCGAMLGQAAIAGGSAVGLFVKPSAIAQVLVGVEVLAGWVFGAVMLPALAWALLRHVPLGYVLLAPTLGAALGQAAEWIVLDQSTLAGAATGAVAASALVARWPRRRAGAAAVLPTGVLPVGASADGPGHAVPPRSSTVRRAR